MNSQKYEQDQHDYTTMSRANMDRNSTQSPLDEQLQSVSAYWEEDNQSSLGTGFYTGCPSPSVNPGHSTHTQSWMNSHAAYGLPLTTTLVVLSCRGRPDTFRASLVHTHCSSHSFVSSHTIHSLQPINSIINDEERLTGLHGDGSLEKSL